MVDVSGISKFFDIQKIIGVIIDVAWMIVKKPFEILHSLPSIVRTIMLIILIIFTLIILYLVLKNRDAWREVTY